MFRARPSSISGRAGVKRSTQPNYSDLMPRRRSQFRTKLEKVIRSALFGRPNTVIVFTEDMTVDAAWNAHPDAPMVFAQHNLPDCDGCSVRFDERLSEAAEAYGIDMIQFLNDLNTLGR